MNTLFYKLDTFITRITYKYNNSFLAKILKSKFVFFLLLLIFIISFGTYIYIVISNSTHGFQRMFNHYIFKIDNIKEKLLYISIITSIYFIIYYNKKIIKLIKKYIFNFLFINYLLYVLLIFLLVDKFKNQVLLYTAPIVLYFTYKIYLYIKETKEKYKFNFIIDSRYFFLIALILLIYTPIYIYFDDKKIAEQLSIYTYYALVIGVIYEIIISNFEKKKK